jgi:hypothetical protein
MEASAPPRSRAELDQRARDARRNDEEVLRRLAALRTFSEALAFPLRLAFPRGDVVEADQIRTH